MTRNGWGWALLLFTWFRISATGIDEWRCGVADTGDPRLSWARQRAGARPAAPLAAMGVQRLLLVRVDFSDRAGDPLSAAAAAGLISAADLQFGEMSGQRLRLAAVDAGINPSTVTPTFRLPLPASSYAFAGIGKLREDALAAALAGGIDPVNFDLDVICFGPVNGPTFNFSGFANQGSRGAWLRDSFFEPGNLVHELGHNFGLTHANGWDTAGGPTLGEGVDVEYADVTDTMGRSTGSTRHFNMRRKAQLGWVEPVDLRRVETGGVYRLYAHDAPQAVDGPRALLLTRDTVTNYWLEFRQRLVETPGWTNTLGIRWAEDNPKPTLLLDTTPGSPGQFRDAGLKPGWTFSDVRAGIHVRNRGYFPPTESTPAALDIEVQLGAFPGNQAPVAELVPGPAAIPTGTSLTFTVTAADGDGDSLGYAWDFGDGTFGPDAASVAKTFGVAGDFLVRCVVSDGKGGTAIVQSALVVGVVGGPRVVGRVRRPDGTGAPGVRVVLGTNQSTLTDGSGEYIFTGVAPGQFQVRPVVETGVVTPPSATVAVPSTGTVTPPEFMALGEADLRAVTLVPTGATWRYLDNGTQPPPAWVDAQFADESWRSGPAPLGYGYPDLGTSVGFGPNPAGRWITTYFRRRFSVPTPTDFIGLKLGVQRDDAVLISVNGKEVYRQNLPNGLTTFLTLPLTETTPAEATRVSGVLLSGEWFREGLNTVTAEVHQWRPTDTDLRFEAQLQGLTRVGVLYPARILAPPASVTVSAGQSAVVGVEATGTEPLTFQWQRNGAPLPGATNAILTIANAGADDGGEYSCLVANSAGEELSTPALVAIQTGPGFLSQPIDLVVNEGSAATFSGQVVGTEPLQFQWLKGDVLVAGATNPTLVIPAVTPGDAGAYRLRIMNPWGSITSTPAGLTVIERPRITQPPTDRTVLAGQTFSLGVAVTGTAPFSFQWYRDGGPIQNGTSALLEIAGLPSAPPSATFSVRVGNPAGEVTSAPVTVTILSLPEIRTPLENQTVATGASANFEIGVNSVAPPSFRWLFGTNVLAGATGPRLELTQLTVAQSGVYRVVVGGSGGFVTNEATLTVLPEPVAPVIVVGPSSLSRQVGESVTFQAEATGEPRPTWQWFKDGQPLASATNSTLLLALITTADEGAYFVRAQNSAGIAESEVAQLTVRDPVNDRSPTIQVPPLAVIFAEGAIATLRVEATGSPAPSYQWRKDGVDIVGATAPELVLGPGSTELSGAYSVVVANRAGVVESVPALVDVGVPPLLIIQPASADLIAGVNRSVTAVVSSPTPLALQWWRGENPVPQGTNATLRLTAVTEATSGSYRLIAANRFGSVTSQPAVIRVFVRPEIVDGPVDVTVPAGAEAAFSVVVTGTPPLTITWRRAGQLVATQTNETRLRLPNVTAAQAGVYTVTVGNFAGTVTSLPARLTIGQPVSILRSPGSTNVSPGAAVELMVLAGGDGPLIFQWRRNGQDLVGATNATLRLSPVVVTDAGGYSVFVRNAFSGAESATAEIIVQRPVERPVFVGIEVEEAGVRVRLRGTPGVTYLVESAPLAVPWIGGQGTPALIGPGGEATVLVSMAPNQIKSGDRFFRARGP